MYDAKTNPRGRRPAAFFLAILLALSLSLAPAWAAEGEKQVIPLGRAVGIKLFSSGVLVVDLSAVTGESGEKSPAKSCGLKEGDVIVSAAGSELRSTEQLQELLQQGAGETLVELQVRRGGQLLTMQAEPVLCGDGVWRLGAWIRDSMAGIGTMTYYDPASGTYGALGHGITDVDTALLMPLYDGQGRKKGRARQSRRAEGRLFGQQGSGNRGVQHGGRHLRLDGAVRADSGRAGSRGTGRRGENRPGDDPLQYLRR